MTPPDFDVRLARIEDAAAVGRMLEDFAREFETPTADATTLTRRVGALLERDEAIVPFAEAAGEPAGFGILIARPTTFVDGLASYLEELYVIPRLRGMRIGSSLIELAMREARGRGVEVMEIGVDEPDVEAMRFYERHGFSNRAAPGSEERMFLFERDLDQIA